MVRRTCASDSCKAALVKSRQSPVDTADDVMALDVIVKATANDVGALGGWVVARIQAIEGIALCPVSTSTF